MLFRQNQHIFYVGVLNDCSKFWLGGQVAAFQLSGGNFVVEFGAVGRSESSKHVLRFKIWPDTNCALWHSRVTFRAWVTRFAMLQMGCPSLLLGRQNQCWKMSTRSRNSEFWINLGSVSYSPDTSSQPWHGTCMTIGRILRCKQTVAPCFFNMQSYWSASGGRVQLSSVHEWSPWMSFGSWKVIHGVSCSF